MILVPRSTRQSNLRAGEPRCTTTATQKSLTRIKRRSRMKTMGRLVIRTPMARSTPTKTTVDSTVTWISSRTW